MSAEEIAEASEEVSVISLSQSQTSDNEDSLSHSDDEGNQHLEDMAYYDRAVEEIRQGDSYTCMICTVEMDYQCQMYACSHCYRVFDYDCIREWALKSTERTVDKTWKCPNCSHVNKKVPANNRATCWCGKVVNPEPNQLSPNSCGQTCNANICVHGCSKVCHLGPHPECTRTLDIECRCGRHTKEITCFQSKKYRGKRRYQCDEECGLLLPCGIHRCKKVCHSGICGACPETLHADKSRGVEIKCYCGMHHVDSINCKDVHVINQSKTIPEDKTQDPETWIGVYACEEIRSVEYACRKHSFFEKCVSPPSISGRIPCPFSPKLLKTCPCGKTPLAELAEPRRRCTDPIPHCDSPCGKALKCGIHTCPFTCHEGDCMDPCLQIDKVKCACHQSSFLVPCQFDGPPHCNLKCESLMSCRRHRCHERCCPGRPSAELRKKTHFRTEDLADETLVEPEHVCVQDCNLMLTCGLHHCQRKCHPGKCPPCLESDSNDLVCPCGKTIVEAPVRCGTKLPPCRHPCIKVVRGESECGHAPAMHLCHPLDVPCPPCTFPVFKPCKCGKESRVPTVCFQTDVSCGKICGKPLDGCEHTCQKKCHLPGECQTKCKQVCKRKRVGCEHLCPRPCHGMEPCPDDPCSALLKIRCPCGRREKEVVCGATAEVPGSHETIPCDEECEVVKRHEQLKAAFGIGNGSADVTKEDSATLAQVELDRLTKLAEVGGEYDDLVLPYAESTVSVYARQSYWCEQISAQLDSLIADPQRGSYHFKPMREGQRRFVMELARAYGLYTEAQDREPNRSVFVKKQNDSLTGPSAKPTLSLADVLPLYQVHKQAEKERKTREFETHNPVQLMNITVPEDTDDPDHVAEHTGIKLLELAPDVTDAELREMLAPAMQSTLVSDPQYWVCTNSTGLVFPAAYASVSANCERDLALVLPHIARICKENLAASSAELCNIEKELADNVQHVSQDPPMEQ